VLYVTSQRQQTFLSRYAPDEKCFKLTNFLALGLATFCNWSEIRGRTVENEQVGRGFDTPDQLTNFTEDIPFVLLTLKDKLLDFHQTNLLDLFRKIYFSK
jgi:hypothetical protein